MILRGSCLCRKIKYEIHGGIEYIYNCHCSECRKSHGAAFASVAKIHTENLHWISGKESLSRYISSDEVTRHFCSTCGAYLVSTLSSRPEFLHLRVGTLDDDPGVKPMFHMFVGSKAPWFEITDNLPQYQEFPEDS